MLGITLEGGASRTVYSCGIIDALIEEGIFADYAVGVSAGAAFGVNYFSKQTGRNFKLATEFMSTKKYMGVHHLLDPRNRSYYNLDYAYDDVPNRLLPFDYKAFDEYPGKFYAVVTNIETGKAEYMQVTTEDKQWQLMRATCALPLMFPEIELNGQKYLDGGIADSIPFKQAIKAGCDKNIVILTRPKDYVKTTDSTVKIAQRVYRKHPEFCKALGSRAQRYNDCVKEIMELKKQGKLFVFTPHSTFGVNRIENDPVKLEKLYRHGYNHAKWAMNDLKNYLNR